MTLEQELFSWSGWDGDPECMIFYDAVLVVPIGEYQVGTKFDCAIISVNDNGTVLQLSNKGQLVNPEDTVCDNVVMGEYKLHYRIGQTISEKE